MRYSIIIPIFNTEKYLCECIESILAQVEKDFEILLLNDGSTDNSGKICDEYAKKYPNQIKAVHKEQEGQIFTRKLGLSLAQGEFVIYIDSDDMIHNTLLSEVSAVLVADKEIDFLCYDFQIFTERKVDGTVYRLFPNLPQGTIHVLEKKDIFHQIASTYLFNSICTKVIRRELALCQANIMFPQVKFGEDILQQLEIVTQSRKVVYLPRVFYRYRTHENAITKQYRTRYYDDMKIVYGYIENYIRFTWKNQEDLPDLYTHELSMVKDDVMQYLEYAHNFSFFDAIKKFSTIASDKFFKKAYRYAVAKRSLSIHLLAWFWPVFLLIFCAYRLNSAKQ